MRDEQLIKAKINYLNKVKEKIRARREEVTDFKAYPDLSTDKKYIYSMLMGWLTSIDYQINALQYALGDTRLHTVKKEPFRKDISLLFDVMGGSDLFREEPLEFVMRKDGLYLSGFMTGYEGGKEKREFFFKDRAQAHVFKWCERDNNMIKELMYQRGAELVYVWEDAE